MIVAVVVAALVAVPVIGAVRRRRAEVRRAIEIMLDPPADDPDELLAFQVAHGVYRCPPGCVEHESAGR